MSHQLPIRLRLAAAVAVLSGLLPNGVLAVPAAPGTQTLMQPDGTTLTARLWGDERQHGWETVTGRTIVKDPLTQHWSYAVSDGIGSIISSGVRVVTDGSRPQVEQGFAPRMRPQATTGFDTAEWLRPEGVASRFQTSAQSQASAIMAAPLSGIANVPVILANFSNTLATNTPAQFNTLLFGASVNSMSDYYWEVSYGQFSVGPGPSGIAGWYKAANTHDYYGANDAWGNDAWPGDLVYQAVAAADAAGFNFAAYDRDGDCYVDVVDIVHQGSGEEAGGPATDIWSHSWNLYSAQYYGNSHYGVYTTNDACNANPLVKVKVDDYVIQPERLWGGMQTMGVFAHEYGHALGLPDLYDTDGSSEGNGNWTLMAGGSWNGVATAGDRPAHLDPWSKYKMGWLAPALVSGVLANEPVTAANVAADAYQVRSGSPTAGGEYFLVENRQKAGFDAGLPGAGLLIWHIDEAKTANTAECYPGGPSCATQHYHVALVQADNLWELEKNVDRGDAGDPYPGSAGKMVFDAASAPNSNLYSGAASNVCVSAISAAAPTMTATLGCATGGAPDLMVTAITTSPAAPAANGTFSATVTVKNQGTAASVAGRLDVWTHQTMTQGCGSAGNAFTAIPSLAAGASASYTLTGLPAGAAGTKTLRVFVDSACASTETNETNNQLTKSYTVVTALPDLAVTAVTINPTNPRVNGTFSATVTVKNQGTAASLAGRLDVWTHQTVTQGCGAAGNAFTAIPSLAAGASTSYTLTGLPAGAAGTKTLRAFVDSACVSTETNETNNQLTKSYRVR